jgi:hypothetical protein
MTKPQIKIVNAETGEEIVRDMNKAELLQWETDKAEAEAKHDADVAKQTAKDELLAKLGISADEAKLLIS